MSFTLRTTIINLPVDDWMWALAWAGPEVDAIQLDMPWPDWHALQELLTRRLSSNLETKFIIQVGQQSLKEAEHDPNAVAQWLLKYRMASCLDYILFDMSAGQGIPMRASNLIDFLWTSLNNIPYVDVAVAGGLGPTSTTLAEPIVRDLSREQIPISFDAQSKLRPSGNAMDPIDWGMAEAYLREAAQLLRKYEAVCA